MVSLTKIMLIGNLGTDPEMRFTPSGTPVASFSLATNRVYTASDGERKQETEWFRVSAWRKQAESCNQFLTKGQRVYVEGSLRTRTWEDREGQKRVTLEVNADRVLFLDKQALAPLPGEEISVEGPVEAGEEEVEPEDLPF
ncbi:MAG: single-stranded DNA-binding protein [Dehalococcoidia bacterium]|nr:single-stranded DNA-binding protein [Dehalococcoidia bacterium]